MFECLITSEFWTQGSLGGSLMLGSVAINTLSAIGVDAGKKTLGAIAQSVRDSSKLGEGKNADLLRALRHAECEATIVVCELALLEDYHASSVVLRAPLLTRLVPTAVDLGSTNAEIQAALAIRQHLKAQQHLIDLAPTQNLEVAAGITLADTRSLALLGTETSTIAEVAPLDETVSRLNLQGVERVISRIEGASFVIPLALRVRMERDWFAIFVRAFRENLKHRQLAKDAFYIDTLMGIDAGLRRHAAKIEARLDALDEGVGLILVHIRNYRVALDAISRLVFIGIEESREAHGSIQQGIYDLKHLVLEKFSSPEASIHVSRLFTARDAAKIFRSADPSGQHRTTLIEELMDDIVVPYHGTRPAPTDLASVREHFIRIREKLNRLIPGVQIDEESGRIDRISIRHVILRADTVVRMLSATLPSRLESTGFQVGRSAATDLIERVIVATRRLPTDPTALVALWDCWDSSGGWGRIDLLGEKAYTEGAVQNAKQFTWELRVRQNFLTVPGDLAETHRLCAFWSGYIEGFLGLALHRVSELMDDLDEVDFRAIQIRPYQRIESVSHIQDMKFSEDVFRIVLVDHPFSPVFAQRCLARRHLRQEQHAPAFSASAVSLRLAEKTVSHARFMNTARRHVPESADSELLESLLQLDIPRRVDLIVAKRAVELASRIVDGLVAEGHA